MTQKLYFGGDIITLEENLYVECVLIENDKIVAIGTKEDVEKYMYDDVEHIDLQGKTLMPAFIDAHSHFTNYAISLLQVDLSYAKNFNDIKKSLTQFVEKHHPKPNEWIIGFNYDENYLEEKTYPTKKILDEVIPDNPVVIKHQSGHTGVFNSKAIEILKIQITKDGYLEEEAFTDGLKKVPTPPLNNFEVAINRAQEKYLSYGITTMQEGMIVDQMINILEFMVNKKLLKIDLVGYADMQNSNNIINKFDESLKKYHNRFKIGGYKVFLDGSPQEKTAWVSKAYENTNNSESTEYSDNSDDAGHSYGIQYMKDAQLTREISDAIKNKMQVIAHCNGDMACEQFIRCYKKAHLASKSKYDIRPVIIHAQLLTQEQLNSVKPFGMIPSFFVAHIYYWGDIHIKNLGMERAKNISIAKSALDMNIIFTFHQDTPVIEPNMLETIWCAVNRITKDGVVLGENEHIDTLDAIKAVTINAAYQYFEEDKKGSLAVGKLADFVILDQNPLKINPKDLRNINVVETIKEGISLYKK